MDIFRRKKSDGEKERKVKLSRGGNPAARPLLTRIYGMVGCLIVTLIFIAIIIFLQKKLPSGSKSSFHVSVKREVGGFEVSPQQYDGLEIRQDETTANVLVTEFRPVAAETFAKGAGDIHVFPACFSTTTLCPTPGAGCLTESFTTPCGASTPTPTCFSTTTVCPTPGAGCFTESFTTPCGASTPTPTTFSRTPVEFNPEFGCFSSSIACVTEVIIPRGLGRRQSQTDCTTSFFGVPCSIFNPPPPTTSSTTTTPPTPTPTLVETFNPEFGCWSSSVACTTEAIIPRGVRARDFQTDCSTSFFLVPCTVARPPSTTPSPTPSPTPTDPCLTSTVSCPDIIFKRQQNTECSTSFFTVASCLPSTTPVSVDPCVTPIVSCPKNVDKRARVNNRCSTSFSTAASCISSSNPPSQTPTTTLSPVDPCITPIISCPDQIVKRQFNTECSTSFSTAASCISSSSTPTPTPTPTPVDPCVTPIVSCPDQIVKRQFNTDCSTSFSTAASCISSSSSTPTPTPTPTPVDPCVTPIVSCPDIIFRRGLNTDCSTSFSTAASCISSSNTASPTSSVSVDPCVTPVVSCPVIIGKRQANTDCSTSFSTAASCLSSSITPTPTSSRDPCITSVVSCPIGKRQENGGCSTTFFTVAGCISTSSPPIITSSSSSVIPVSSDPCISSTVFCPIGKRQEDDGCSTSFFTVASCISTSNPTITSSSSSATPISSDPCVTSVVSCPIGKRQEDGGCSTSLFTASSCILTSSPTITSSSSSITPISSDPCITSVVSCPIGKRQEDGGCSTSFLTASSCISTSSLPVNTSSSSSSSVTQVSSNPCITSTVSCPIGKRQEGGGCSTSFFTVSSCISSPSSSPIITSSSSSITPVSSDSCITSTVSCPDIIGKRQENTDCSTSFFTVASCISSSTPTFSPTSITPTILPSCMTTTVSCITRREVLECATSFVTIPGCGVSSSSSSSPITTLLPSSSSISSVVSPTTVVSPTINPSVTPSSVSTPIILSSPTSSLPVAIISLPTSISSLPATSPGPSLGGIISSIFNPPTSTPASTSPTTPILVVPIPASSTLPFSVSLVPFPSPQPTTTPQLLNPTPTTPLPTVPQNTLGAVTLSSSSVPISPPPVLLVSNSLSLPPPITPSATTPLASIQPTTTPLASIQPATTPLASIQSAPPSSAPSLSVTAPSGITTIPTKSTLPSVSSTPSISSLTESLLQSAIESSSAHPIPTSAGGGGGGGGGGGSSNSSDIPSNTPSLDIYPIRQIVVGNYVPVILGRSFVQLISPFYHHILLHEPIRLLTNPEGAPFSAIAGSPGMSIPLHFGLFVAQLGSAFTVGATYIDTDYCDTPLQPGALNRCAPRLTANPGVMDVILISLIVQALTILFVIAQWWRKPNSLRADPTSIAGVAVVMGHPKIEADFSSIPAETTSSELSRQLKGQKYKLGMFTTTNGVVKYGIMPANAVDNMGMRTTDGQQPDGFLTKVGNWWMDFQHRFTILNNWRNNRLYFDSIFTMLLVSLLALTIAAMTHINKPKLEFLASAAASGTGMRIFFAILGVIVSSYWGRIFRDMQTFAPYKELGRGASSPRPTILLSRHTFPITAFLPLLFNGHMTAASVAFTGLVAEFLIIALAGLPYRPGQQRPEFILWSIVSLAILSLMVIQLIIVNVWRRKLPQLDRAPNTIASVMTYVAGTDMRRDFDRLSQASTKERNKAVKELRKEYAYGWRRGEDGRVRWVVDEVKGKEIEESMRRLASF